MQRRRGRVDCGSPLYAGILQLRVDSAGISEDENDDIGSNDRGVVRAVLLSALRTSVLWHGRSRQNDVKV